jgi:hypothetical protein
MRLRLRAGGEELTAKSLREAMGFAPDFFDHLGNCE